MTFRGQGSLSISMFVWGSMYLGTLIILISAVGTTLLADAFVEVREFRILVLLLVFLSAAYVAFGILALRYRATRIQRLVLSVGPGLLAILFAIDLLMSDSIPQQLQHMESAMIALQLTNVVCVWVLAISAYRFVSRNRHPHAT